MNKYFYINDFFLWNSNWFCDFNYFKLLFEDVKISKYLSDIFYNFKLPKIHYLNRLTLSIKNLSTIIINKKIFQNKVRFYSKKQNTFLNNEVKNDTLKKNSLNLRILAGDIFFETVDKSYNIETFFTNIKSNYKENSLHCFKDIFNVICKNETLFNDFLFLDKDSNNLFFKSYDGNTLTHCYDLLYTDNKPITLTLIPYVDDESVYFDNKNNLYYFFINFKILISNYSYITFVFNKDNSLELRNTMSLLSFFKKHLITMFSIYKSFLIDYVLLPLGIYKFFFFNIHLGYLNIYENVF